MDWRPFSARSCSPIGIDVAPEGIHLAQVARDSKGLALRALAIIEGDPTELLADPKTLRSALRTKLRSEGFRGRRFVMGAPEERLRLMALTFSAADDHEAARQIVKLAQERTRSDLSDSVVDYVPIRTAQSDRGERSALVAVAPVDAVQARLDAFAAAGLRIEAVEVAPLAVRRFLGMVDDGRDGGLSLVVRIGPQTTQLTLLSGRRLLLYREAESGHAQIVEAISKGLDCTDDEARSLLARYGLGEAAAGDDESSAMAATLRELIRPELRALAEQANKAISYAAFQTRGTAVGRVVLLADPHALPQLDVLLSDLLQLPVQWIEADERFRRLPHASARSPRVDRVALALGFALRGFEHG